MADDEKAQLRLEIAHVLFIDIVGYSKLLIDEQSEALYELNRIVRHTDAVREAEAAARLTLLPTGDGMALVFTTSVEAPVECALQINQALRAQPSFPLRMGIHSGPIQHVQDVNGRTNAAGAGLNIAQRVMDCGDAGHILCSKRVADDLAAYRHWQPYLHDLGDFEVKHGVIVSVVNLYAEVVGNPVPPAKFAGGKASGRRPPAGTSKKPAAAILAAALLLAAALGLGIPRWEATHRPSAPGAAGAPGAASGERRLGAPPAAIPEKSVAVLPFEDLSGKQDNGFADGIGEEIHTDLSKVADLKVVSRRSVQAYGAGVPRNSREIGQALGVAHLLVGTVSLQAGKVRVSAQLIDTRSDSDLWADSYERDSQDIFAIQTEVAKAIVNSLRAKLSPDEMTVLAAPPPTDDVEADQIYLRAQAIFESFSDSKHRKDSFLKALELLDQATARDPKFALAYCLEARIDDDLYWFGIDHTPARLEKAQAAVNQALSLRPALGEAHLAQALLWYHGVRNYPAALRELAIARAALPNDAQVFSALSWIERRQGHWTEAVANQEKAVSLDPGNESELTDLTVLYDLLRRYQDENRAANAAIKALPQSTSYFRLVKAQLQIETGQLPAAAAILATVPPDYDPDGAATFTRVQLALYERKYAEAKDALAAYKPDRLMGAGGTDLPRAWIEGLIARAAGQGGQANAAFVLARGTAEAAVEATPDDAAAWALLGEIDAGLGRQEDAVREGSRAVQLRPSSDDAEEGPEIETMLALIEAWTGDRGQAVARLAGLSTTPAGPHYGDLRFDPAWDALEGDPGFAKILAGMTPPPVHDPD